MLYNHGLAVVNDRHYVYLVESGPFYTLTNFKCTQGHFDVDNDVSLNFQQRIAFDVAYYMHIYKYSWEKIIV